jgi:hypothetical protein
VLGLEQDVPYVAVLDDAAGIHDGHLVRDLGGDAEIVGDEDH